MTKRNDKAGHGCRPSRRHFGLGRLGAAATLMVALGVPGAIGIATMLGSYQDAMGATITAPAR